MSAWAPSLFDRANALSKSSRLRTSRDRSLSRNALAAASISVRGRFPVGPPGTQRKATRATLGKASLSSSNRLPSRSAVMRLRPVIFPPGRARLETSPPPTGSPKEANTMGIVGLAFLAAKIPGPVVTMTSTLRLTSSAARSGSRSSFASVYRYSMTMFFPSTYPSSRSRWRNASTRAEAFRQRLRELGYVEGKNIVIEYRYTEAKLERLPDLAAELVSLKVDVIVTTGPGILAAKKASPTMPIVFASFGDPVGGGLVSSLARPGGNITGLSLMTADLDGKRLELLKEAFPKVARVAFLWVPGGPTGNLPLTEMEAA